MIGKAIGNFPVAAAELDVAEPSAPFFAVIYIITE